MKKIPLISALIGMGAFAIIAQVLFIREFLVVFYGNELCLGMIFASWLVGIAFGAWVASRIDTNSLNPLSIVVILLILMATILPPLIYLARITREIFGILPGEFIPFHFMFGASMILISPCSFLIGFIFPFACKAYVEPGRDSAAGIGWVYILEAVGSIIGGLVMTFYLILFLNPFQIIGISSLVILANGLALSLKLKSKQAETILGGLCLVLIIFYSYLFLSHSLGKIDEFTVLKRWNAFSKGMKLIDSTDSRYQNIIVALEADQYNVYGNGQYFSSFPDEYYSATFAHLILTQHPNPQRVLLIGDGAGGILKEMLKHPILRLNFVELDPKLIKTIYQYLPPEDKEALTDKRVRVHYSDGRRYLKENTGEHDMIILNIPDPSTAMLNRFYTVEFFREARERLKTDGILVTNVSSGVNYIGREVGDHTGSIYQTLLKVFPYILVTPGDVNYFFASSTPGIITSDTRLLASRYVQRDISTPFFSQYHFQMLLPPDRVRFIQDALNRMEPTPVNTDLKPIAYFYNLVLWAIFSGGREKLSIGFLQRVAGTRMWWFLLPLFIFLVIRVAYVYLKKEKMNKHLTFNCLFAITTTGFAGLALEIVIIFSFQNIYGYVYQKIGLIVALFMVGLTLGGYGMNLLIQRGYRRWTQILMANELMIFANALVLPYIFKAFAETGSLGSPSLGSEYVLMILVALIGFLTGFEFPLVSKIISELGMGTGKVAGIIDGFDHFGACLGGFFTGSFLVPLFGTEGSCILIAALNLLSFIFLLFSSVYYKRV